MLRMACLALALATTARAERPRLVLIAPPPLDAAALADVLRVYLDAYAIDVQVAEAGPAPSLQGQLDEARAAGSAWRAIAVVRLQPGAARVEVQLIDRLGDKALVASLPRGDRAEDLHRTVALKVGSLLRSALYEEAASPAVQAQPSLARMVAAPPASERLSIELAYALVAFPERGLIGQGATVGVGARVVGPLALALAGSVLSDFSDARGDVAVTERAVPLWLAARLAWRGGRFSVGGELYGGLLVNLVRATSATSAVAAPATWVDPFLGVAADASVRAYGPLYVRLRAGGAALLDEQQLEVRGEPVLGLGRWAVTVEAGLVVALL